MGVKRIVPNVRADHIEAAKAFYSDVLDMAIVMDHEWILTFAAEAYATPQISVAAQGGAGTPVPDFSIEVDNLDEVYRRVKEAGPVIEYGPADESWGVKRFHLRDPFGRFLNILSHG